MRHPYVVDVPLICGALCVVLIPPRRTITAILCCIDKIFADLLPAVYAPLIARGARVDTPNKQGLHRFGLQQLEYVIAFHTRALFLLQNEYLLYDIVCI